MCDFSFVVQAKIHEFPSKIHGDPSFGIKVWQERIMSTTPEFRNRCALGRSSSLLERSQSPQQSPSRYDSDFDRQNCSTPLATQWRDDSDCLSPGFGISSISDIHQLPQEEYMRVEVGWRWDSPKSSKSQLAKKKIERKRTPVAKIEDSSESEAKILRAQSPKRLKRHRKPPKDKKKCGVYQFKEDVANFFSSKANEASDEISKVDEKSESSKQETTADMLKYVLEDSDYSSFSGEKTLIPGPSTAKPLPENNSFFNNSAIDRDLCALVEEIPENPPPCVTTSRPGSTTSGNLSEFSQKTSSEEMYFTVKTCIQRLTQDMKEGKATSSREDDLKCLIDDSFDECLSQMPLDGPSNSRNTSFGRHASMPAQKQTVSQVARGSSKGIFRYDSMPMNSTSKEEDPLSRNGSLESVSSSSSKCSSKEIEQKRIEAFTRLKILKQQQLSQQKKNLKK